MPKALTSLQLAQFRRDGFLAGIPVLDEKDVELNRRRIVDLFAYCGTDLSNHILQIHTLLGWAFDLGRRPEVLDCVEDILGQNILIWKSKCFLKPAGPGRVPWHQDLPHWNLDPSVSVTAWIAVTGSAPENGCVRMIPGSHRHGARDHAAKHDGDSLLTSGLELDPENYASSARDVVLASGEMSLHDGMIVHGSGPNRTDQMRIGLAFVYTPAYVRQTSEPDTGVVLARGVDEHGFFPLSPPPGGADEAQMRNARRTFQQFKSKQLHY